MMTQKGSRQTIKVFVFRPDRKPNVGERIGVYWKDDKRFYAGEVSSVDQDGKAVVNYDDGDTESLNMDNEIWEFANDPLGYRADSQKHRESNSDSDTETDDSHAEDKNGRESVENDDEERNIHKGQASGSRQDGSKRKRRKTQNIQNAQKIQKTQRNPAMRKSRRARRARRAQRAKRAREVQELETRQNNDHMQSVEHRRNRQAIQYQQDAQNEKDENNAEHVHEARTTRVTSPLLIKHLPPVKRYARILKLKQRGYKNEGSILEMAFDS